MSIHESITAEFGDVKVVTHGDGSADYVVGMIVGGRNKYGDEYILVLDDGPAQGERVYV